MNGAKSEGKVRSVPLEVGLSLQKIESSRGDERSNTKKRGVIERSDCRRLMVAVAEVVANRVAKGLTGLTV